ncbi:MAG: peptidase S8 and S53 subtilisin kexin sedolisin [Halieaceae bacterium]|nr:peptidase S8 and S53 subtilisin kexin sedolisin [Halieaceae bacterium]
MRAKSLHGVGVIDSAIALPFPGVCRSKDFSNPLQQDTSHAPDHGRTIIEAITNADPTVDVYLASVFNHRLRCTPAQVATAMDWLITQRVSIINLSFGLGDDREILRTSCERALDLGICLVAASPAQGAAVYPASYPGVISATGDARCAAGEISWLNTAQADFGGYPGNPQEGVAGASVGCASVCGALARLSASNPQWEADELRCALVRSADYRGPEKKSEQEFAVPPLPAR